MVIDNKYDIGQFVYLNTDDEQKKRIVTAIKILPAGIFYCLTCGTVETDHYDIEITAEVDVMAKIN